MIDQKQLKLLMFVVIPSLLLLPFLYLMTFVIQITAITTTKITTYFNSKKRFYDEDVQEDMK